MAGLKIITPPGTEPVTLDEVKLHIKASDDEDANINRMIISARQYCEEYIKRKIITQTWELYLDHWHQGQKCHGVFSDGYFIDMSYVVTGLPYGPVNQIELAPNLQSVVSVSYYTADGSQNAIANTDYEVDNISIVGRIVLSQGKSWPTDQLRAVNGICIRFICGYGDGPNNVPQVVRDAIMTHVAISYLNRESDRDFTPVNNLLSSEKVTTA